LVTSEKRITEKKSEASKGANTPTTPSSDAGFVSRVHSQLRPVRRKKELSGHKTQVKLSNKRCEFNCKWPGYIGRDCVDSQVGDLPLRHSPKP